MMSFKIPCGGFKLDEKSFSLDKNDVLSIPKPLTYDYMPEGYPSKGIEYVTLFGEYEVPFYNSDGHMATEARIGGEIAEKDKLTVVWDGISYDVVVKKVVSGSKEYPAFGNLALANLGDATDYPFFYMDGLWVAADTATSHTIKVMRQQETITPMSADFLPVVDRVIISSSTPDSAKNFKITVDDSGAISATEVT